MKKGQRFFAPRFGHEIEVTRVSKNDLWADIVVHTVTHTWRKRQRLDDDLTFPFETREIG